MTQTRSVERFYTANYPDLRAFALSRGIPEQDTGDLIHDYMISVVEGNILNKYDPAQGPFENYILTSYTWQINSYWAQSRPKDFVEQADERGIDEERVTDFQIYITKTLSDNTNLCSRVLLHLNERINGDATSNTSWAHAFNKCLTDYKLLEAV